MPVVSARRPTTLELRWKAAPAGAAVARRAAPSDSQGVEQPATATAAAPLLRSSLSVLGEAS